MQTRFLTTVRSLLLVGFLLASLANFSQKPSKTGGKTNIRVHIQNFDGTQKTAFFQYFDTRTQEVEKLELVFDKFTGTTHIQLDLEFPLYNSASIGLTQERAYGDFLLMPNEDYNFVFDGQYLFITGESGTVNRTLSKYRAGMSEELQLLSQGISKSLDAKKMSYVQYKKQVHKLVRQQYLYLKNFVKRHPLPSAAEHCLRSRINYNAAWQKLSYFTNSFSKEPKEETLEGYLQEIIALYPVNAPELQGCATFQKYLDLLVNHLSVHSTFNQEELEDLVDGQFNFSNKNLQKIAQVYKSDFTVLHDEEFKFFWGKNGGEVRKYILTKSLERELQRDPQLDGQFAADIVLAKQIKFFVGTNVEISAQQWQQIKQRFHSKQLYNDLVNRQDLKNRIATFNRKESNKLELYMSEIKARYFPKKEKSRSVFLNMYKYAEGLTEDFLSFMHEEERTLRSKGLDVVNLCVENSTKEWQQSVAADKKAAYHSIAVGDDGEVLRRYYGLRSLSAGLFFNPQGALLSKDFQMFSFGQDEIHTKLQDLLLKTQEP